MRERTGRSLVISDNMSTPYVNAVFGGLFFGWLPPGSVPAIGGPGSKRSTTATAVGSVGGQRP